MLGGVSNPRQFLSAFHCCLWCGRSEALRESPQPQPGQSWVRTEAGRARPGQRGHTRVYCAAAIARGEGLLHAFWGAPANGFLPWVLREGLACM